MDPLTALGLASNVIACISFASDLIKGTIDISTSPDGSSDEVSKLDSTYNELKRLCVGLESCADQRISAGGNEDEVKNITLSVKRLSESCNKDCNELLEVLSKLKTRGGGGRWASFGVAIKTLWEKKKIDELEERLSKTQQMLTLHICTLANYSCSAQSTRHEELLSQSLQLQSNQQEILYTIKNQILAVQSSLGYRGSRDIFAVKDVADLQEQLQSLSLSGKLVAQEQSILRGLTFDCRPVRHTQIVEAHEETFQWALETDPDRHRDLHISEWVRSGSGIFWVSGKPGSGKSTLMKHLADSPITFELIQQWAYPNRALVASHYFWIAGTPMQKSHMGLLRTLLYDIFRKSPSLISKICSADRWARSSNDLSWSLSELQETLKKVSSTDSVDQKFCFFIDGLDEFDGDHEAQTNLCLTFKELAKSENIKLILSSRPWNIFEEQFGSEFSKVYMQELTHDDIQAFAQSRLKEHPRWTAVSANCSEGDLLVSEITNRSEGVFLWVHLVIKLLKEGLTNHDGLSDLHRRLESFPTELEPFFKTILNSVEPFYHSHMATMLQVAIQWGDEPMGFLGYYFHNKEYEDSDYAVTLPLGPLEDEILRDIKSDILWHLDSRTRGLLEFIPDNETVTFLHRTARDFLRTREMHDFLTSKVDTGLDFNPFLSLLKMIVALIKVYPGPTHVERVTFGEYATRGDSKRVSFGQYAARGDSEVTLPLLRHAMRLAQTLERDTVYRVRCRTLLNELERVSECLFTGGKCTFTPSSLSIATQRVFREQLVCFDLFDYIRMRLDSEPTYLASVGSLLPLCLLTSGRGQNFNLEKGRGTEFLVHILERRSIDLMAPESFEERSPWRTLLSYSPSRFSNTHENCLKVLRFLQDENLLVQFLNAGADPNDTIYWTDFPPILKWGKTRPTALLYTQLCFQYLDRSLEQQRMYLDVLEEIIRLSNSGTLKAVCSDFASMLSERAKSGLPHHHLSFLSRVNDYLFLSLDKLDSAETRKWQDGMAQKVFPPELYVPRAIDQSMNPPKVNRKRKSRSDDMRCTCRQREYYG